MKFIGCFFVRSSLRASLCCFLVAVALLLLREDVLPLVITLSPKNHILCEGFVLPGTIRVPSSGYAQQTKTRSGTSFQSVNPWKRFEGTYATTTFCCPDDSFGYSYDYDCFDCSNDCNAGGACCEDCHCATKRKRKNNSNSNDNHKDRRERRRKKAPAPTKDHNPSRREFVAWNSILAGLASGAFVSISEAATDTGLLGVVNAGDAIQSSSNVLSSDTADSHFASSQFVPYSSVRKYKSVTLSNGMKVLLVSDKTARQSSAALTIRGAGQFSDPTYLNGLAHLTEHMVLSSKAGSSWSNQGDFQEWLDGDYAEGFSNGFTAYEKVCFHFQCGTDVFAEALDRFSNLFLDRVMAETCQNKDAVRREIRRVSSELDKNDLFSRELYLTKSLINPKHPYSEVTLGSIETLETLPDEADISVSKELYAFYKEKYRPDHAILVVVGSASLSSLEAMVQPFSATMIRQKKKEGISSSINSSSGEEDMQRDHEQQQVLSKKQQEPQEKREFPPFLLPGNSIGPICLFRGKVSNEILADNLEKISFQWALDQDYTGLRQQRTANNSNNNVVTATQIGFVMAEILGRRGPGSLFRLLQKRKWLPEGNRGVPRISFPVDVSGFQILRLEIIITLTGFAKRSSVIAAVYDYLACLRANPPGRELIAQYCAVGQLYGHALAPRPPDAIELAFDGQIYGVDGPYGVGTPSWRLMPLPEDSVGVRNLQKTMQSVLTRIADPSNAITIMTASQRAILSQRANDLEETFPLFSPASWNISPTTQARYLPQNNVLTGKINEWLMTRISPERLQPPVLNPLIPPALRSPRIPLSSGTSNTNSISSDTLDPEKSSLVRDYWALMKVYSNNDLFPPGLSLPRAPPEPSSRSLFVLQLLSSRPPRATAEMAAHAEVWRISLEYALVDLAELGAPAGLAYDISYNKYGMRVAFLGLSQNIASYARRIGRRMVDHTSQLLEGPEQIPNYVIDASIRNTNRFRMSPKRKAVVTNTLKQTNASDAAREGTAFFKSCSGAVCFSKGDLLPAETLSLLADLKDIFRKTTGINVRPAPAVPEVEDLLYRANWIPRAASVCTVPGSSLISNPCGRVPR